MKDSLNIDAPMDDYGTDYRGHMSTMACQRWYIAQSAYGGAEQWDGWAVPVI